MTTALIVLQFLVIVFLAAIIIAQFQYDEVKERRRFSDIESHDRMWSGLMDVAQSRSTAREQRLESDIRALTEALGRSKEYVQVVYPRDPTVPLEESPGWYDAKPVVKVQPIRTGNEK